MRDIDVRLALRKWLESRFRNDTGTLIIEEMGISNGSSRIDVAAINGLLHGYEIKSNSDTLQRLLVQSKAYCAVFDEMSIVVGTKHIQAAMRIVPEWWGVIQASLGVSGVDLLTTRMPQRNPGSIDAAAVAALLWREEALSIVEEFGGPKSLRTKPRRKIYEALASSIDVTTLCAIVRQALKSREEWRSEALRT